MIWIALYLAIAYLSLANDATNSYLHKRRFNLFGGLLMALVWPLSLGIVILYCRVQTRHHRSW